MLAAPAPNACAAGRGALACTEAHLGIGVQHKPAHPVDKPCRRHQLAARVQRSKAARMRQQALRGRGAGHARAQTARALLSARAQHAQLSP